jgi:nitrite reductase/ring-hydroxylating ferredoxin subunit
VAGDLGAERLLALRQEERRRERLATAIDDLTDLKRRLRSPKSRLRAAHEVDKKIEEILARHQVGRYLTVRRTVRAEHRFRQMRRGRPSPNTPYRKTTRRHPDLEWRLEETALAYDRKSDGMYPLLTNDKTLTPAQVLEAHKGQPTLEKRFQQTKTVHEIAPVLLKNPGRIEALFTLSFLGLLVQAPADDSGPKGYEDGFLAGWTAAGLTANGRTGMGQLVRVASSEEIPPRSAKLVEVEGKRMAVFNVDGRFHAIDDTCPHRGGLLSEGELEGEVVTCPWLRSTFNVTTGAVLSAPARDGVSHYSVRDSGGELSVEV